MKINEVVDKSIIGEAPNKVMQRLGKVGKYFSADSRKARAQQGAEDEARAAGKEQTKVVAQQIKQDWLKVSSSKGIKLPNPKISRIMDPNTGSQSNITFATQMAELEKLPDAPAASQASKKDFQIKELKKTWFKQEVMNPDVPVQELPNGGFYFSKIRKFLIDTGIREGTLDKIVKNLYPEISALDPEKVYDNPKLILPFLDKVFIKIAQKATDYHGNFYGSKHSSDAIAQAKGSVDPTLIKDISNLSPAQKVALANILATGTGHRLEKGQASDPKQQQMDL